MFVELGHFSLIAALSVYCFQFVMPVIGVFSGDHRLVNTSTPLTYIGFLLTFFAFCVLVYCYCISDFSVLNVVQNSHSEKPFLFKLTGVWGNHEGSMLLWATILTFVSAVFAYFAGSVPKRLKALTLSCQAAIATAFLLFIVLTSNPFLRVFPAALQGNGLNPILQDIGLAIHPPLLYLGYVGSSVCFSFAIAALIEGDISVVWARWIRPWVLLSWIFLTAGIAVGSYWAYYELGWGGFWSWDPVENASLMPWLTATALLHSAIVLEKRGALKIWTTFLAIVTFSLSLMGTFLVRSGILTSVHSFATDPRRGVAILIILSLFIGVAFILFAFRAVHLKGGGLFRPISKEGTVVLNNLFLASGAASVLIGTLYPLFLEVFNGDKISVGPAYFHLTFVPLIIPLLMMMPFGPLIAWKKGDVLAVSERLWFAFAGCFIMIAVMVYQLKWRDVVAVSVIGLAFFIIAGAITDPITKSGLRGTPVALRVRRLFHLPGRVYGTALAHAGVGVMLFAIVFVSAFGQENIIVSKVGQVVTIAGKTLRFDSIGNAYGPNYSERQFVFALLDGSQAKKTTIAARRFYPGPKVVTTEVGIMTLDFSQIYIAPGQEGEKGLVLHIWWKPNVLFIWLGAMIMILGGVCSLCSQRLRLSRLKK